ncbi:MAG: DUF2147 domain-containing protein [Flavipsychrobacter sp.]
MKFRSLLQATLIAAFAICYSAPAFAGDDPIEGVWYSEDSSAKIKIYLAKNQKFYGKIIWLKNPNEEDGTPKVDDKNPDKSKRSEPILNMLILKSFEKDGDKEYEDGTIYDPKSGKTYSCTITHKGNSLKVRGYIGISLIGRTAIWTKAD